MDQSISHRTKNTLIAYQTRSTQILFTEIINPARDMHRNELALFWDEY